MRIGQEVQAVPRQAELITPACCPMTAPMPR
ncbi:hypothetical protein M4D49_14820 [Cupriavidus pauculus]|nr:hypothetical protein [Cupriavidus pauculus]